MMIAMLVFLVAGGCATSADCDPDQELRQGMCFAVDVDAGATGGADECDGVDGGTGMFGATCTDGANHSDCDCPAPYCAIEPGMSEGTCTRTGCIEHPERCPDGYRCVDLSVFDPSLPSICSAE